MSMQFKGRYGESAFVIASRKVQHQKVEGCSSFLGLLHKACSEASDFQKSELFDIFLELDAGAFLLRHTGICTLAFVRYPHINGVSFLQSRACAA